MTIRHRNPAARAWVVVFLGAMGFVRADEPLPGTAWVEQVLKVPYAPVPASAPAKEPVLQLLRQDFEELEINRSVIKTPMKIGTKPFQRGLDTRLCRYPFSFVYGGRHSDEVLPGWTKVVKGPSVEADRSQTVTSWTDPQTGLTVEWHVTRYRDFPAVDWVIWFRNDGPKDTPILADVQALDLSLDEPIGEAACYRLHRTNGAPSNPTDFEPTLVSMAPGSSQRLGGGGGRSSNKDFPFVKIESAKASYIAAVGWSGQWAMRLGCRQDRRLHATAGLEITRFKLHPGERVRTPRVLMLCWPGDTLESNAQFRQLIYKHYAARRSGQRPLPTLFCNTCFTRGGGWLNECNAENQISLIRAYAPLGLEALITDAGWFEGGWPAGAGNWNPRKEAYPQGMAPVAAAAKEHDMAYGLWFEFERVVPGTWLHKNRPQWLLRTSNQPQGAYLLNLGLPEVRQYLFDIVKGFMDLPGFAFYRSDFNMDPLPYWRFSDPPDRQGIAEMKYVEGLYDFWDRLAREWPDALREECASGGRRIDLETIARMHLHQESDYWFDNEVDAAVIWSLSRYLPNNTFTTPLVRLDDRSFHSTLGCSLIPGWIADAKDFDAARAQQLTDAYRRLRHLLVGAWYPLTPYSRDGNHWMAMQFHRPDLGEGLILVIPPRSGGTGVSPVLQGSTGKMPVPLTASTGKMPVPPGGRSVKLALHGLDPRARYELDWQIAGRKTTAQGSALMKQLEAAVPPGDGGERIVYRRRL